MSGGVLVLAAGVLVVVVCLGMALAPSRGGARTPLAKRALGVSRRSRDAAHGKGDDAAAAPSVKREGRQSSMPGLEHLVRRFLPRQDALRDRLARTGRDIGIGPYVALNIGLMAVVTGLMLVVVGLEPVLAVAVGVLLGVGGPHVAVGRMARKRIEKFANLFPDAIDLIVRGIKSGLPVTESIAAVGRELADPVGAEFRTIAEKVKFGQPLEEALWETAARLDTPEFKFFVISLSVQRETGGNLGETLANLSDILRRRRQMRLKVKAMSSEARSSALILGSLPFVMFGLIYLLNPGYETDLFTDPRGRIMLVGALVTMGLGILVMRKMVRFDI